MRAKEGGNFKAVPLPEPQTTVARCYSVIHIGTIPNVFGGQIKGEVEKMHITWEMPKLLGVFDDDKGPQPFVIGLELTLSTNKESNLAKLISQWRGKPFTMEEQKGFDPSIMIGKKCLISFVHKTKKKYAGQNLTEITNANTVLDFNTIMQLPKEMECPAQINESYVWDWEPIVEGRKPFDKAHFEKMPNWIQEKIKTSNEFKRYAAHLFTDQPAQQGGTQQAAAAPAAPPAAPIATDGDW